MTVYINGVSTAGDMLKATYDPDMDGIIALAQLLDAVCSETEADNKIAAIPTIDISLLVGESPDYGGTINALAEDATHVYAAGSTTVRKYLKTTMALDGESPDYGAAILALAEDATHVYAAGGTTQTVRKYLLRAVLIPA
ncbi:hypothetical protein ES703_36207 [subsurface metagenome]